MKPLLKNICTGVATGLAIALGASVALANLPTYHTLGTAAGTAGTTPATEIFPADPNSQIRVITVIYTNDNSAGTLTFTSGGTAWSTVLTNLSTFTTNAVYSTNGMYGGEQVMLQHNGICYTNSIATLGYGTNVNGSGITNGNFYVSTTTAFGVAPGVGDNIWQMTNSVTYRTGSTAGIPAVLGGDDIYSGNYGAPVEIQLCPSTTADVINSASAHYDSASQP